MKRERVNKQLRIEGQIAVAENNLAAANAKALHWQQRLKRLRDEQLRLRLESQRPLGRYTKKNEKKYLVWQTISEILSQHGSHNGLTTSELLDRARSDYGPLNAVTFRAYLREFSEKHRLIEKHNDRWNLCIT